MKITSHRRVEYTLIAIIGAVGLTFAVIILLALPDIDWHTGTVIFVTLTVASLLVSVCLIYCLHGSHTYLTRKGRDVHIVTTGRFSNNRQRGDVPLAAITGVSFPRAGRRSLWRGDFITGPADRNVPLWLELPNGQKLTLARYHTPDARRLLDDKARVLDFLQDARRIQPHS